MNEYNLKFEKTFTLDINIKAVDKADAIQKAQEYIDSKEKNELLDMSQEGYFEFSDIDIIS